MRYEAKYESSRKKLYVFAAISLTSILLIFLIPFLNYLWMCIIFFCMIGLAAMIGGHRVVLFFDDKMLIQNLFGKMIMEVYFDEIKRVGFLHASNFDPLYSSYDKISNSSNNHSEELILLLKDGSRMQIDGDDIEDIHAVCAYIQRKIGQF